MNILVSGQHYPVTVLRFFKAAFQQLGIKVFSVGPFHERVPWAPQVDQAKWIDRPDLVMPEGNIGDLNYVLAHPDVRAFKPEAIVQFDAAYWLSGNKPTIPWIHVATDPHCLDYHTQFAFADLRVSLQKFYGVAFYHQYHAHYVGYGYDPRVHYYTPKPQTHDATLITGLMYDNRKRMVDALRAEGVRVLCKAGLLLEDGTEAYNQGLIALNWSSEKDLPMRFWEGLAYRNVVVTNRVPDLDYWKEFVDGQDYLGFDTLGECVEKVTWVLSHPEEAKRIARNGQAKAFVGRHTYTRRAMQLLGLVDIAIERKRAGIS